MVGQGPVAVHAFGAVAHHHLLHGGDVVSFAGDALSAVWNTIDDESPADALARCARCSANTG